MPPLPVFDAAFQRAVILLLPFIITAITIFIVQPDKKMLTGIFLGSLWNFLMLVPLNLFAVHNNWWIFGTDGHLIFGLPFDILLGWAVWWGAALFLLFKGKYVFFAFLVAFWVDLLFMPRLSPFVIVYDGWLWGEALALAICFIPGWLIAAFTAQDIYVGWRAAAQAVMTGILLIGLLPAALLEHSGRSLWEILNYPSWQISALLNILLFPIILGLAGNQEFAERGHGTPIPFDPPKKLVVTGPYAYVRNPMQICIFLNLIILGIFFQSLLIIGAAAMSLIYCSGVVRWHHTIDMEPRFGKEWAEYQKHVPNWLPHWKPWIREYSTVYFARHCGICQDTEHWLRRLNPKGLHIEDSAMHEKNLERVAYRYPDGSEVKGICAIAACLNHVNFAFAFFGWFMRLPAIRHFLQLLIDGAGERARIK